MTQSAKHASTAATSGAWNSRLAPSLRKGTFVLGAVLLALVPATVQADLQASVRYGFGLGGTSAPEPPGLLIESTLRSELLFGAPGDEHVRVGPAIDLRTNRFRTFEAAAGLAVLLPIARGFPIVLTAGAGYGWRRQQPNAPFLLGTLAWGYRSYNFHSPYGLGLQLYVSARVGLDPSHYEITAGIEIDLEALVVIPGAFLISLFRRGPPDEPENVPGGSPDENAPETQARLRRVAIQPATMAW